MSKNMRLKRKGAMSILRKKMMIAFLCSLLVSISCSANFIQESVNTASETQTLKKHYGDVIVSRINSVYDGDTFKVDLDDYPPIIGDNVSIRVIGIDAPEIRSKDLSEKELAYKARDCARQLLLSAKIILLKNLQRDKYFRILADVWCDDTNLGEYLIEQGLAVAYNGGKRPDWSQIAQSYTR